MKRHGYAIALLVIVGLLAGAGVQALAHHNESPAAPAQDCPDAEAAYAEVSQTYDDYSPGCPTPEDLASSMQNDAIAAKLADDEDQAGTQLQEALDRIRAGDAIRADVSRDEAVSALATALAIVNNTELTDEQRVLAKSGESLDVVNQLKKAGDMPMYINDDDVPENSPEKFQP